MDFGDYLFYIRLIPLSFAFFPIFFSLRRFGTLCLLLSVRLFSNGFIANEMNRSNANVTLVTITNCFYTVTHSLWVIQHIISLICHLLRFIKINRYVKVLFDAFFVPVPWCVHMPQVSNRSFPFNWNRLGNAEKFPCSTVNSLGYQWRTNSVGKRNRRNWTLLLYCRVIRDANQITIIGMSSNIFWKKEHILSYAKRKRWMKRKTMQRYKKQWHLVGDNNIDWFC